MATIYNLPPELLSDVLSYLPLRSLLSFASTTKNNRTFALACLNTLNVGIHPSRQAAVLSDSQSSHFSEIESAEQSNGRTNIVLPAKRCKGLHITVCHQNEIATKLLRSHGPSIRTLDLSIWDIQMETAIALSKASRLRHLTLRMDHPHTRVKNMPGLFWYTSPGSTIWNQFYGAPTHFYPLTPPSSRSSSPARDVPKVVFGQLETLHLERAGITDYQIQRIISENPHLKEIRLKKCFNLTDEFFRDLAKSEICSPEKAASGKGLQILHFEMSSNAAIDSRILKYISSIPTLKSLSFSGCSNLQNQEIKEMNETEWQIPNLTLPQCEDWNDECSVEIDPSYVFD